MVEMPFAEQPPRKCARRGYGSRGRCGVTHRADIPATTNDVFMLRPTLLAFIVFPENRMPAAPLMT